MQINSIKNKLSFGALMLEKSNTTITSQQKMLINNAKQIFLNQNRSAINLLENMYTDVYISPNTDGKTVDVKLLSAAGHTYNYIPKDDNGELKIKLHIPVKDPKKWDKQRIYYNTELRLKKFINRAIRTLYSSKENPENIKARTDLEYISMTDRDAKTLQLKENLPKAKVLYGIPAVMTRDFTEKI